MLDGGDVPVLVGSDLKKGMIIDERYRIERQLGVGGGGAVYQCCDLRDESHVAVKILLNRADLARFKRERQAQSKRRSKHIVHVLDAGKHEDYFYLVLELMTSGSLRDLIDKNGKLSVAESAWLGEQIVRGLDEAKTVHRDLKPENVLLQMPNGAKKIAVIPGDLEQGVIAKVADFGLAKGGSDDSSLTMSGQVMGTPAYMSPEQCRNAKRVSEKTDTYAIGAMLTEMVTGKPPFKAGNVHDLMAKQVNDTPKLGQVPAALRPIIEACLAKNAGPRPTRSKLRKALVAIQREALAVAGTSTVGGGGKPEKSLGRPTKPTGKQQQVKKAPQAQKAPQPKKSPGKKKTTGKNAAQQNAETANSGTVLFFVAAAVVMALAACVVVFRDNLVAWLG